MPYTCGTSVKAPCLARVLKITMVMSFAQKLTAMASTEESAQQMCKHTRSSNNCRQLLADSFGCGQKVWRPLCHGSWTMKQLGYGSAGRHAHDEKKDDGPQVAEFGPKVAEFAARQGSWASPSPQKSRVSVRGWRSCSIVGKALVSFCRVYPLYYGLTILDWVYPLYYLFSWVHCISSLELYYRFSWVYPLYYRFSWVYPLYYRFSWGAAFLRCVILLWNLLPWQKNHWSRDIHEIDPPWSNLHEFLGCNYFFGQGLVEICAFQQRPPKPDDVLTSEVGEATPPFVVTRWLASSVYSEAMPRKKKGSWEPAQDRHTAKRVNKQRSKDVDIFCCVSRQGQSVFLDWV